jgi:hypothetical protein
LIERSSVTPELSRIQLAAIVVGVVGVLLCVLGVFLDPQQFFYSYLFAWHFWLGLSLGSMAWLMVHFLAGGGWSALIRRLLEANMLMMILMALLFVPIFFGLQELYSWTRPEVVAVDYLIQAKQPYLNVPFFTGRAIFYFVLWIGMALLIRYWSTREDRSHPEERPLIARRLRVLSGPGIVLYGISITFASTDWLMSLDPHWFSTIFGVLIAVGQVTTGLAFTIVVLTLLAGYEPFVGLIQETQIMHLGNLLLASVILWSYLSFMQYLIIWGGNIPEEVTWYIYRLEGGWQWVALFLLLFHFVFPFAMLLARSNKQHLSRISAVALVVMLANLAHLFWLVNPTLHPARFTIHWLDIVTPIAIGGIWIALFVWVLFLRPLVPPLDPILTEARHHGWDEPPVQ